MIYIWDSGNSKIAFVYYESKREEDSSISSMISFINSEFFGYLFRGNFRDALKYFLLPD